MNEIVYKSDAPLSVEDLVALYRACSLGDRRPLGDVQVVQQMLDHANLIVSAWDAGVLVGLARTLTDFGYTGYMADLAVRESHQRRGIGVELIRQTRARMGPWSSLVLRAAPEARDYYRHIGFVREESAWALASGATIPAAAGSLHQRHES